MPRLIRLYIIHSLIGSGIAAAFVVMLVWLDLGGIGHLVRHAPSGGLAAFVLFLGTAAVFAPMQFAIAVAGLARDDGPGGGRGTPVWEPALRLIPVRAARRG